MPHTYNHLGVRFQYPDNWRLDNSEGEAESELGDTHTVSVSSPGGAFWTLVQYPPSLDPAESVNTSLNAMRDVYPDLDAEIVDEEIVGHRLRGYDLNFICLDLTNTALIRGFRTATASFLIFCQADDRELELVSRVFKAITTSLLQGQTPHQEAIWPPKKMFLAGEE